MREVKFKQSCACTHCGNEAEMVVTCSLESEAPLARDPKIVAREKGKIKGQAACSQCGGEADIWLDY